MFSLEGEPMRGGMLGSVGEACPKGLSTKPREGDRIGVDESSVGRGEGIALPLPLFGVDMVSMAPGSCLG